MSVKQVKKEDLVVPSCREACPAGIDIPRYIRAIKEGRFDEALAVIRERIPFPSVCGYACYSPCEASCGNRQFGEPVAIRALKRAAAEKGGELWRKHIKVAPSTGKKVAVVGSGPSGLTAAYYLTLLGHKVTIFEAHTKAGGMMRLGIPEYRLPREVLDKEIAYLEEIGVDIITGHRVDSVDELLEEGYEAVYLACGAPMGIRLGIPGDDLEGVMDGIEFLKRVNAGQEVEIGDKVAVIGGGNTAVDAARSALRIGAREVVIKYRRSPAQMTAYEEEVGAALTEGVQIAYLTAPVRIERTDGALDVTFIQMSLGEPDETGRPRPIPVEGSESKERFDNVIAAIGQAPDISESIGIPLGEGNLIKVDPETLSTGRTGVFAGGDVVTGPSSIIDAIAQGRKAASSIDRFLGGSGEIDHELLPEEKEVVVVEYQQEGRPRISIPCIPVEERRSSFKAVEETLSEGMALQEAERCRSCDARRFEVSVHEEGCKECGYCIEVCGLDVFDFSDAFNNRGYRPVLAKGTQRCVGCMLCFYACPDFSIEVKEAG